MIRAFSFAPRMFDSGAEAVGAFVIIHFRSSRYQLVSVRARRNEARAHDGRADKEESGDEIAVQAEFGSAEAESR